MRSGAKAGVVSAVALCLLLGAASLALAASASAKETRLPQSPIGAFTEPKGLAVDQGSHDVYVIDGRSEVQQITISATAGKFKLKLGAASTGELSFNANEDQAQEALRNAFCAGGPCLNVIGGPGNATGSKPFLVRFSNTLASTDVEQIECVSGSPPSPAAAAARPPR